MKEAQKKKEKEDDENIIFLLNRHNSNRSVLDGDPAIEAGIYSLVAVTRGTVLAHRARAVIDGGAPLFLFKGVFSVAILARERAKI